MPDFETISADTPDWSREDCTGFWEPGRRLLRSIRHYQEASKHGVASRLFGKYWVLEHRFWSVVTGADIPLNCDIGGGFLLPHPNGVVIFPDSVIGPNCLVFQQVTIGVGGTKPGAPVVGGNVYFGAGAKVLGGVHIGDHARIGANAVVLQDFVAAPEMIRDSHADGPRLEPLSYPLYFVNPNESLRSVPRPGVRT
jgi:serine O-acetyltransferase